MLQSNQNGCKNSWSVYEICNAPKAIKIMIEKRKRWKLANSFTIPYAFNSEELMKCTTDCKVWPLLPVSFQCSFFISGRTLYCYYSFRTSLSSNQRNRKNENAKYPRIIHSEYYLIWIFYYLRAHNSRCCLAQKDEQWKKVAAAAAMRKEEGARCGIVPSLLPVPRPLLWIRNFQGRWID